MGHPNVFSCSRNGLTREIYISNLFNVWYMVCHISCLMGGIIYLAYSLKGVSPPWQERAWQSGTV